jgi:hypothetical protein
MDQTRTEGRLPTCHEILLLCMGVNGLVEREPYRYAGMPPRRHLPKSAGVAAASTGRESCLQALELAAHVMFAACEKLAGLALA